MKYAFLKEGILPSAKFGSQAVNVINNLILVLTKHVSTIITHN